MHKAVKLWWEKRRVCRYVTSIAAKTYTTKKLKIALKLPSRLRNFCAAVSKKYCSRQVPRYSITYFQRTCEKNLMLLGVYGNPIKTLSRDYKVSKLINIKTFPPPTSGEGYFNVLMCFRVLLLFIK